MAIGYRRLRLALAASVLGLFAGTAANAFDITITVDQNGNGHFVNSAGFNSALAFAQLTDTGPGGRANALTYNMLNPPGLTAGDVFLTSTSCGGCVTDLIRFNPDIGGGSLIFYSTNAATLAGIGLPTANYATTISLGRTGTTTSYTPVSGQAGFVSGAGGPITYQFVTAAVPEPASWALMVAGFGMLGFATRKSHRVKGVLA